MARAKTSRRHERHSRSGGRRWWVIACLTAAFCLSWVAPPSQAKPRRRVVVMQIRGAGAAALTRFLRLEVETHFRLVEAEAIERAAGALDIARGKLDPPNLQRIARQAEVDAVVTGVTYRWRRKWWLKIEVRDGGSGRIVKRILARYPWLRMLPWTKQYVGSRVRAALAEVEGVPRRPRTPPRAPPRRPPPPLKRPAKTTPLGRRAAHEAALVAGIGMELLGRRFVFNQPGPVALFVSDTPLPPVALDLELYPGAFVSRHRVWGHLGLGLRFTRAFGIASARVGVNEKVDTTVQRIEGFVVYRFNLRRRARTPTLKFELGLQSRRFDFGIDLGPVPSVSYLSARLAVRARFPLGAGTRFALLAGVAGLITAAAGQVTDAQHYGAAQAGGIEADLGVEARLFWQVYLRAGVTTRWIFLDFSQRGVHQQDYEFIAESAADGYFGGYARLMVAY